MISEADARQIAIRRSSSPEDARVESVRLGTLRELDLDEGSPDGTELAYIVRVRGPYRRKISGRLFNLTAGATSGTQDDDAYFVVLTAASGRHLLEGNAHADWP